MVIDTEQWETAYTYWRMSIEVIDNSCDCLLYLISYLHLTKMIIMIENILYSLIFLILILWWCCCWAWNLSWSQNAIFDHVSMFNDSARMIIVEILITINKNNQYYPKTINLHNGIWWLGWIINNIKCIVDLWIKLLTNFSKLWFAFHKWGKLNKDKKSNNKNKPW